MRTRPENVRLAAEMCVPGAECTVNFEHWSDIANDKLGLQLGNQCLISYNRALISTIDWVRWTVSQVNWTV